MYKFFNLTAFHAKSKGNPPDLIISEIRLDEISGIKSMEIIKKELILIKFIIINGLYDHTTANTVKSLGGVDYILQPFDVATLISSIKKALTAPDLAWPITLRT